MAPTAMPIADAQVKRRRASWPGPGRITWTRVTGGVAGSSGVSWMRMPESTDTAVFLAPRSAYPLGRL